MIPMPVDDPLSMAWLDLNDLGNAERLVRLARGLLLWVPELEAWVGFDTRRWSGRDGNRMAAQLAHDVARHIDAEAAALDAIAEDGLALEAAFGWAVPPEVAKDRVIALRKHAVKSGNASMTEAMLRQARTLISARREEFDVDPLTLNVANGTLRFVQRVEGGWDALFAPHDPRDMLMQIATFAYDAAAQCPEWMARMELVQPKKDMRRLLQMTYGYCLTGLSDEQKWFLFQGRGGDGKSLTNDVISRGLGDYHRHAEITSFLEGAKKSGSDHSSDMARLQGAIRMVTCEEPPKNSTWNGGRLKQVTGGTVTARPLRMEEIEYKPNWKLIVEVNPLPAVSSDDDGFWRRLIAVPWSYQFDKGGVASEPFKVLSDRLVETEGSGILNWMIAGCLKWLERRRLPVAEAATAFTLAYRKSAGPIGEWYMECCDISDPDAETPSGALYGHFKEWCEAAGMDKIASQTAFGRWLRDKQHGEGKDRLGKRFRRGIRIRPDDHGLAGAAPPPTPQPSSSGGVVGRAAPQAPDDFEAFDDDYDPDAVL